MATQLVSFLGTGTKTDPGSPRGDYKQTRYDFGALGQNGRVYQTSLFGAALLDYLRKDCGRTVDRWLLLGTPASLWSELRLGLPQPDAKVHIVPYEAIDKKVEAKDVTQADLDRWESHLNAHSDGLEFKLVMTDLALDRGGQAKICQALLDGVTKGSDLAIDMSHGLRHHPIIASFAVGLMRRTHQLGSAEFFAGAYEARDADGVAPVVRLDICSDLLLATENTATRDISGNYVPLAEQLGIDARKVWFREATNQIDQVRPEVRRLSAELKRLKASADPVKRILAAELAQSLPADEKSGLADRVASHARRALEYGGYSAAAALCMEAILMRFAGGARDGTFRPEERKENEKALIRKLGNQGDRFKRLRQIRNACAHGSRAQTAAAQKALASPDLFVEAIQDGLALYDELDGILKPAGKRTPASHASGSRPSANT